MNELIDRLERAVASLKAITEDRKFSTDLLRLQGKIEGVELALSYAREEVRRDSALG